MMMMMMMMVMYNVNKDEYNLLLVHDKQTSIKESYNNVNKNRRPGNLDGNDHTNIIE